MRNNNRVFSSGERKGALWAVVVTALIVAGGAAYDRFAGPSLGLYASEYSVSIPGVLDAQPLR